MKRIRKKAQPTRIIAFLTPEQSRLRARARLEARDQWTFVVPNYGRRFVVNLVNRVSEFGLSKYLEATSPEGTYWLIFLCKKAFPADDLARIIGDCGGMGIYLDLERDVICMARLGEIPTELESFRLWLAGNPERN